MAKIKELRPCPFCGGKAFIISATHREVYDVLPNGLKAGYIEMFMARCSICGASSDYNRSLSKVAVLWNARASKAIEEGANTARRIREEMADILIRLDEIARCEG